MPIRDKTDSAANATRKPLQRRERPSGRFSDLRMEREFPMLFEGHWTGKLTEGTGNASLIGPQKPNATGQLLSRKPDPS